MSDEPLILGVDYYLEGSCWVFTAHYLAKRGYCCETGCRHCPFGFRKVAEVEEDEDTNET